MKKKQSVILIIVIILLFTGIIVWLSFSMKPKTELPVWPPIAPPAQEGIFGLTGWVLETDTENNFLIVKSERDKRELKVFMEEGAKLLKIERPEDHPGNGYVITIKTPMELADFQRGDYISLRTRENIAGKTEFGGIIHIYFYPSFAKLDEY